MLIMLKVDQNNRMMPELTPFFSHVDHPASEQTNERRFRAGAETGVSALTNKYFSKIAGKGVCLPSPALYFSQTKRREFHPFQAGIRGGLFL